MSQKANFFMMKFNLTSRVVFIAVAQYIVWIQVGYIQKCTMIPCIMFDRGRSVSIFYYYYYFFFFWGGEQNTLLEAVRHFCSVVMPCRFMRTNAHAQQCCIFQSYAKNVLSRMKLTMKLTMHEPASMTTDKGA